MNQQNKRYDVRTQLYRHDYRRLQWAAEAENRTVSSYVKNLIMETLDSFEKQLDNKR